MKKRYFFTAAVMMCTFITGCGGNEGEDVAEANLPYGATMLTDTESGEVPVTYDRRFINKEEAVALSGYFTALEKRDTELLDKYTLDLYTDFVLEAMYQNLLGFDALVSDMSASFSADGESPYEIKEVEINSFYTKDDEESTDLANLYNMLSELSEEENYVSHITDGKFITYTIRTDTDGEISTFTEQNLFLIQVDGEYVVCS